MSLVCPLPFSGYDRVVLAHGGGGRAMQALIRDHFAAAFGAGCAAHDGAVLPTRGPIAMTTDAFTVRPLFFPGGDIGSLAVHGTVNDLAMCGARPRWLAASFVLEEGLLLAELDRIVASMAAAARAAGVVVVTGDTKVVERGRGDGVYITTTGVGELLANAAISPTRVVPGDAILVSGPVGEHGIAVLLSRLEGVANTVQSDQASVADAALSLLEAGLDVHCLRDPTRGGLAAVVCELAEQAGVAIRLEETAIPARPEVADACELLGLDPIHVACEGRFVAVLPAEQAASALALLRAAGGAPAVVGAVVAGVAGRVTVVGPLGGERILDLPSGEQLPRIC